MQGGAPDGDGSLCFLSIEQVVPGTSAATVIDRELVNNPALGHDPGALPVPTAADRTS
jgi:hypothetical protein